MINRNRGYLCDDGKYKSSRTRLNEIKISTP